jgi:hypothetical protein
MCAWKARKSKGLSRIARRERLRRSDAAGQGIRLGTKIERGRGGGIERKRAIDRGKRRLRLATEERQHKPGNRQRGRIVGVADGCRARVLDRRSAMLLVKAVAREAELVRPREQRACGSVVRVEHQRLLEQRHGLPRFGRHLRRDMRQRAKIEIVGIEVPGPLAA